MLSFDVSGAGETLAHLATIERVIDTTPPLDELKDAVLPIVQFYPEKRANQRYVRTEDLKKGWRAAPSGSVVTFENPVSYAGIVYSDEDQAEIHKGRWPVLSALRTKATPAVVAVYQAAIERIVKP